MKEDGKGRPGCNKGERWSGLIINWSIRVIYCLKNCISLSITRKKIQTVENRCTNSIIKEKGTPGGMERGRQEKLGISDRRRESREKVI